MTDFSIYACCYTVHCYVDETAARSAGARLCCDSRAVAVARRVRRQCYKKEEEGRRSRRARDYERTDGRTNGRSTLLHMQYTFHYDGNRVTVAIFGKLLWKHGFTTICY